MHSIGFILELKYLIKALILVEGMQFSFLIVPISKLLRQEIEKRVGVLL